LKRNHIKIVAVVSTSAILIVAGLFRGIESYFNYLILMILVLQGINAIFDYAFNSTMRVGYAKSLEPTKENQIGRLVLLIIAIALMIFSIWWYFYMPL
jgi:hypothetical protein